MSRNGLALSVALVLGLFGRAAADGLTVGDPAPQLQVKEFVKGEPVKSFEKGKVYVVEFWATWCGPCRTSIPHLSELQKKHKDAVFIGVSVWEQDQGKVKPFVADMGDKMAYRVALDEVGSGQGKDGKMASGWMTAAGQNGIPTAFVVNGEGKVAWIGHPMKLEKPLEEILAGKWDLATAAATFKKEQVRATKLRALSSRLRAASLAKDYKALVALIDEAVKDYAEIEFSLGGPKLDALIKLGDADKVLEYGNRLVEVVYKDKAEGLNAVAWELVKEPGEKPDLRLMKLALRAAQKADKLAGGKNASIADTLAKAYFETGDVAQAVQTQERAIKLAAGTPQAQDKSLQQRLELYRKKAGK